MNSINWLWKGPASLLLGDWVTSKFGLGCKTASEWKLCWPLLHRLLDVLLSVVVVGGAWGGSSVRSFQGLERKIRPNKIACQKNQKLKKSWETRDFKFALKLISCLFHATQTEAQIDVNGITRTGTVGSVCVGAVNVVRQFVANHFRTRWAVSQLVHHSKQRL